MSVALGQLALLGGIVLALLLFIGSVCYYRIIGEVLIRRWHADHDNGARRDAFRRSLARAKRAQPRLRLYLIVAALLFAALVLTQVAENILHAL